jgi:diguanylate cyclase (GGDEF)-like protein
MIGRCLGGLLIALAAFASRGEPAAFPDAQAMAQPRFQTVGDNGSISDGVVTALVQDDEGLVWVGTAVGLVRYDGYQLKPYRVGEGLPLATGTSFVRSLLAAPDGQLWVGLEKDGLARLDTRRNAWTVYRADARDPAALPGGSVRALARDRDGRLWVGTLGGGLASLEPGQDRFRQHRRSEGLPDERIQALLVDSRGDLWVGTWNGLVRRRAGETRFEAVFPGSEPGEGLNGRTVSMVGESPSGQIWVGTRQGELAIVDPSNGQARWMRDAVANPSPVLAMVAAWSNLVWIGRANGIDVRNANDGALVGRIVRDLRQPAGLAGTNVGALMRDSSGGLWAGSYGGGLQRHNPFTGLWVRRGEGREDSAFAEADVTSLLQLRSGEVWAGTNERGIAVMDAQLRLLGDIRPEPGGRPGFQGGRVGSLAQGLDGTVWAGTDSRVYEFSPDRKLRRVHVAGQGRIRRLLAARDGSLWMGTQDGVFRRAPAQAEFRRLVLSDGGTVGGNVNALVEATDGSVWVGGEAGLLRAGAGETVLRPLTSVAPRRLPEAVVVGLLVDRERTLWIDTNAGLFRLDTRIGLAAPVDHVVFKNAANDSPGSIGANLLADRHGRLWTHQTLYDPRDGSKVELTEADGVDIGTGWFRSYTALADGRMLFGGSAGLLVVDPDRFVRWSYAPSVVVSELRLDGEKQRWRPGAEGIELGPDRRSVNIEFAALDYSQPMRNRYRYRLVGFDAAWAETGAEFRVASYANLPPGSYRFEVQGSNRAGDWSPSTLSIPVQVRPAWWQTWWAQLLLAAAVLWVVYAVVQVRTRLLRRRQLELELKVRERTEALEALSLALQEKSRALEESSLTDPLTGLHNRRFLARHIDADVALSLRRHEDHLRLGTPLGEEADLVFYLIDIDHFKQVNDRHGHAAGDALLTQMRGRLQRVFRQTDHLVRWGGEEFLIVARFTSREHAAELAERARTVMSEEPFVLDDGSTMHRSCSVGFACFPPAPSRPLALDWATVVGIADSALYAVKHGGRDGWLGLVRADAPSDQALRDAAASPLAEWAASGQVQMAGSSTLERSVAEALQEVVGTGITPGRPAAGATAGLRAMPTGSASPPPKPSR